MFKVLKKKPILIISFIIMFFGLLGIFMNFSYEYREPDIEGELKATATQSYLENKIGESLTSENFDDVVMYQDLADYLHITLSFETLEEIEKHNDMLSRSWRNTKDFSKGFVTGESNNTMGMIGSISSDITVVGDLRDLSIEGIKFSKGEDNDQIVLGLSLLGIALSAAPYLSVGASILKIAKKTGKLSKSFLNIISSKLAKTVDMNLLKKVDYTSITKIEKSIGDISKSINLSPVYKLFGNINQIKKNTSMIDTVSLMKYVDKPKDLSKIVKLSEKFKANTKAVLKVLGKSALRGATKVVKYTVKFIAHLIAAIISFLVFIITLGVKVFFWKSVTSRVF